MLCARLADHLIRLEEDRRRNGEPQGLSGFEVNDQLELRGLLYGQVGGLGPLEDLVHQHGATLQPFPLGRPIGEQAASFRLLLSYPDHRQSVLEREVCDLPSIVVHKRPPAWSASIACVSAVIAGKTDSVNASARCT